MLTLDAQSLSYDDSTQSLFCAWSPARVSSTAEPLCRPARMRKYPKQTRSIILVTSIKQAAMMVATRTAMEDIQASKICEVAGVAMGSLYQYFSNVDSIFTAIYEDTIKATLSHAIQVDTPSVLLSDLHAALRVLDDQLGLAHYHQHYSKGLNSLFGVPLRSIE